LAFRPGVRKIACYPIAWALSSLYAVRRAPKTQGAGKLRLKETTIHKKGESDEEIRKCPQEFKQPAVVLAKWDDCGWGKAQQLFGALAKPPAAQAPMPAQSP